MLLLTTNPNLLSPAEVAVALRLSVKTLMVWRREGRGPAFIRVGKTKVFYPADALEAWLKEHTHVGDWLAARAKTREAVRC